MPNYEFEIPEAGVRFVLSRPVERRDEPVTVRRVEVPARIAIAGIAPHPLDCVRGMAEGWKRAEERGELAKIPDFTPEQVKAALADTRARTEAGIET